MLPPLESQSLLAVRLADTARVVAPCFPVILMHAEPKSRVSHQDPHGPPGMMPGREDVGGVSFLGFASWSNTLSFDRGEACILFCSVGDMVTNRNHENYLNQHVDNWSGTFTLRQMITCGFSASAVNQWAGSRLHHTVRGEH